MGVTTLLLGLVALFLLLILAGMAYQAIGSARDARRYPPPGRMVDVGGYRLHLYCTGEGNPTVVLDSGLPGTSLSWRWVQPEVASFTRVCSYERAGLGWSEAGPRPRTSRQIVAELRTLLNHAGIEGPYVLVGHSFGGFTARLFASQYPEEVVGMVLVDPIHPQEWLPLAKEARRKLVGGARMSRYGALLARLGIARLVAFLGSVGAARLARGVVRIMTVGVIRRQEQMVAPGGKLPAQWRPVVRSFWLQPKAYEAMAGQIESLPESAKQVAAAGGFGEMPLVVMSAGNPDATRIQQQEEAARLSTKGEHVIAPHSGHWIQLDQPQLVAEAIRKVVESARRG
ncbi:MAG: alpha/beta hydrolase [Acidobacteria bacterium]|nr:alpha/beta hydrolase [Acidobacteriota bacterium]